MTDTTEISQVETPGSPIFDRASCTEEELNAAQRAEMSAYLESLGIFTDPTKTDGYWKLSDQHREEWVARVALRKKVDNKKDEKAEQPENEEEN